MEPMTAFGRILQVIGWLWIAVGFFGPLVNVPDVSVFPGIIILFISRVIRKQGEQTRRQEDDIDQLEQQEAPRPLNTQRPQRRAEAKKSPEPMAISTKQPESKSSLDPKVGGAEPKPESDNEERSDLFERVLLAGQDLADKPGDSFDPETTSEGVDGSPMSSAEMIARAHRRWDRKP